jgi:MoxR-like ATPase
MAKVDVDYPLEKDEAHLLERKARDFDSEGRTVQRVAELPDILRIQEHIAEYVTVAGPVLNYIQRICMGTRPGKALFPEPFRKHVYIGASPRAGEHLIAFCKSFAYMHERDYVIFEDVDGCAPHVLVHRIVLTDSAILEGIKAQDVVEGVMRSVAPY